MADIPIPPWLNIDPVAPVGRYLEGYGLGQRAGAAQTAAAAQAQQMAQQMAIAQQEAAYRQQQQALDAEQFNAKLRLEQERAQREAATAAAQLEGQRGIQEDLQAGVEWPKALAKWAPKLFAGEPRGLAQAMEQITGPRPPVFGKTPEDVPYAMDARGGIHYAPASTLQPAFNPEIIEMPGGKRVLRLSPQHVQLLGKEGIDPVAQARLTDIRSEEKDLRKEAQGVFTKSNPRPAEIKQELAELKAERQSIYNHTWSPEESTAPTTPTTLTTVTTKAQFDALPSGSIYIGKDGRQYRKP